MATEQFVDLVQRYVDRFGELPGSPVCMDDADLSVLVRQALERGTPLTEDDYESGLPDGADA